MKPLLKFFMVLALGGGLNSCTLFLSEDTPRVLPPATMEGKNTFGCLVNGKVWVPNRDVHADMSIDSFLAIYGDAFNSGGGIISGMRLVLNDPDGIQVNKVYEFQDPICFPTYYIVSKNKYSCDYDNQQLLSGHMTITKLETNIVSGTFEFEMEPYSSECGKVKVTKGRFDIGIIY
jgi:hypothetical protein